MVHRWAWALVPTLILSVLPEAASAQVASGYSGYSTAPEEGTDKDYLFMLRQIGSCLAGSKTRQAVAMLAAPVNSAAEGRAFQALFNSRNNVCLGSYVSASVVRSQIRGTLAEALYRRNVNAGAAVRPTSATVSGNDVASLHDFARCYVSRHPDDARALIDKTKLGTSEERAAVIAMSAEFKACLPQRQVELSPSDVRMVIAEVLYNATL